MNSSIRWTHRAESDLERAYHFYIPVVGEEKAWSIIQEVYQSVMATLGKEFIPKVVDHQFSHLGKHYYKLFCRHYKITYRLEGKSIYILRVFDMRQHPDRNL